MQFILISCLLAMLAMQASAVLTPAQRAIITEHVNRFETVPVNRRFVPVPVHAGRVPVHTPVRNMPGSPPHPIFHPGFGKRDVEAKRFDDNVKLTKNDVEAVKRFDDITKKDIPAAKDIPIVEKEVIKRESNIATLPIEKRLAETKRFNEELVKKDVVIRSVVDSSSPIVVKHIDTPLPVEKEIIKARSIEDTKRTLIAEPVAMKRLDTPLPVEKKFIKERSVVDMKRTLPFTEEVATMHKDEIRSIVDSSPTVVKRFRFDRLDTPLPIEKKIIV